MANFGTSYADFLRDNPDIIERVQQRYAQPAPAPVAQPAPAPAPTPEAPTVAPVVNRTQAKNPYIAQAQVQDERIQGLNAEAASHTREGQAKQEMAQKQADALGQFKASGDEWQSQAEDNFKANRSQIEEYKKKHAADLEELRKPIKGLSGGAKAMNAIALIVGAMGNQRQTHPYTGQPIDSGPDPIQVGMGMLSQHIQSGVEKQLQERDLLGKNVKSTEDAINMLQRDSDSNLDTSNKILANRWFLEQRNLEKIAKEAEGTAYGENAYRLSLGAADKAREYEEAVINARIKKAEALRAAGAKKGRDDQLARMTDEQLLVDGKKDALEKFKARQSLRAGEAGIEGTQAETASKLLAAQKAASGTPAPVGWDIENRDLYNSTTDAEKSEFRKSQASVEDFKGTLLEMRKILEKKGTEWTGRDAEILRTLTGKATVSYKNAEQMGALDQGAIELAKDIFGNPNALLTGGPTTIAKLDSVITGSDRKLNAQGRSLGLRSQAPEDQLARDVQRGAKEGTPPAPQPAPAPRNPAPMGPPAPPPAATAKVMMVDPTTMTTKPISPHLVETARARGMMPLDEYNDARRQREYEEQLAQADRDYSEGR